MIEVHCYRLIEQYFIYTSIEINSMISIIVGIVYYMLSLSFFGLDLFEQK